LKSLYTYRGITFLVAILYTFATLGSQPEFSDGNFPLKFFAHSAGRTTGHIATLDIYNPSFREVSVEIGPFFIPGEENYQGFVVNKTYSLKIPPFGTNSIELEGYCTNIFEATAPAGVHLANYEKWVGPAKSAPIPRPGFISEGFTPVPPPAGDMTALTYPETLNPFLYRIELNAHPVSVAEMLIHAVNELERSFDHLAASRQINLQGYFNNSKEQRSAIVQQAFWYYASMLEGTGYNQAIFHSQLTEQIEQSINRASALFTAKTKEDIQLKAGDIWEAIEKIGENARLMAPFGRQQPLQSALPQGTEAGGEGSSPSEKEKLNQLKELVLTLSNGSTPNETDNLKRQIESTFQQAFLKMDITDLESAGALLVFLSELSESAETNGTAGSKDVVRNLFSTLPWESLHSWLKEGIGAMDKKAPQSIEKISLLLQIFGENKFTENLAPEVLEPFRSQLQENFRDLIVREALRMDPAAPGAGKKILELKIALKVGFFAKELGPEAVAEDMIQQLDKKWNRWLAAVIEKIDVKDESALRKIIAGRVLLASPHAARTVGPEMLDAFAGKLNRILEGRLQTEINAVNPRQDGALNEALALLSFLKINTPGFLNVETTSKLRRNLVNKLDKALEYRVTSLDPRNTDFLEKWRTLELFREHSWYLEYVGARTKALINSQQKLKFADWLETQKGNVQPGDIRIRQVELAGSQWKISFPDDYPGLDNKEPLPALVWLGAIPAGAAAALLLSKDDEGGVVPAPKALDDQIAISCTGNGSVNVLINDTGDDITLSSFAPTPYAAVTNAGDGVLLISNVGADSFSFTYTITDRHGVSATGTVFVQVILPELVAMDDQFSLPAGGTLEGNLMVNDSGLEAYISGNSVPTGGNVEISANGAFSFVPLDNFCGPTQFTYTLRDACGQEAEAIVHIFVEDEVLPTVECPQDLTISCSEEPAPALTGQAAGSDNCSSDPGISFSDHTEPGNCLGEQILTRTWTVTDAAGNSAVCLQTITMTDTAEPEINCPVDITVEAGQDTGPSATGHATATDNCTPDEDIDITFENDPEGLTDCSQTGLLVRRWTATDACGNAINCSQNIIMLDTSAPALDCPTDVTVSCEQNIDMSITGEASATDNYDPEPLLDFMDEIQVGACPNERIITRTWTAIDACGNEASCVQVVLIGDSIPPTISLPPDLETSCFGNSDPAMTGSATATDNCTGASSITIEYFDEITPGDCPGEQIISRTWKAVDPCGNFSQGVQTIKLSDNIAPEISCPSALSILCSQEPEPAVTGEATATDNCASTEDIIIEYADETFIDGSGNLTILRTWTATDPCGNADQCVQAIFQPSPPPVSIQCPADIDLNCLDDPHPSVTGEPDAFLDCIPAPDIQIGFTDAGTGDPGCSGVEGIFRTWTAVDSNGNSAACIQTISFQDLEAPQVICPANVTVNWGQSILPADTGQPTATDNCSLVEDISFEYSDDPNGLTGCNATGDLVRTWTATDGCGNTGACNQVISLQDLSPPSIICPINVNVDCGAGVPPANTGFATATDNAGSPASISIQFSDNLSGLTGCGGTGTILRTWTATDACNNSSSCVQTIGIFDASPPILTCPPDVTVLCGQQTNLEITGQATATDNCAGPVNIYYLDDESGLEGCEGVIVRTWIAVDPCGPNSSCQQLIFLSATECSFTPDFLTSPSDCTQPTGTIALTIEPPGEYDLLWNTGDTGNTLENLFGGDYQVTITDVADDCAQIFEVTVNSGPGDYISVLNVNPASCTAPGEITLELAGTSGSFAVNISGASTVNIPDQPSGIMNVSDFVTVVGGQYLIEAIDNISGCVDSASVTVQYNSSYSLIVEAAENPSVPGAADGSITLEIVGFPVYPLKVFLNGDLYDPAQGLPEFTISNLTAGTYSVYVTDHSANQCPSNIVVVTLTDPPGVWGSALVPVTHQFFPSNLTTLHTQTFEVEKINEFLRKEGYEDPPQRMRFNYQFRHHSMGNFRFGFQPGRNIEFSLNAVKYSGSAMAGIDPDRFSGGTPATIRSDFSGWMADIESRYLPKPGHWQPFFGIGVVWDYLRVDNSLIQINGRITTIGNAYHADRWRSYLSGGLRLRANRSLFTDLEFRLMETVEPVTGTRRWDFLPRLSGRWKW
jgi:hypothetical protein